MLALTKIWLIFQYNYASAKHYYDWLETGNDAIRFRVLLCKQIVLSESFIWSQIAKRQLPPLIWNINYCSIWFIEAKSALEMEMQSEYLPTLFSRFCLWLWAMNPRNPAKEREHKLAYARNISRIWNELRGKLWLALLFCWGWKLIWWEMRNKSMLEKALRECKTNSKQIASFLARLILYFIVRCECLNKIGPKLCNLSIKKKLLVCILVIKKEPEVIPK